MTCGTVALQLSGEAADGWTSPHVPMAGYRQLPTILRCPCSRGQIMIHHTPIYSTTKKRSGTLKYRGGRLLPYDMWLHVTSKRRR